MENNYHIVDLMNDQRIEVSDATYAKICSFCDDDNIIVNGIYEPESSLCSKDMSGPSGYDLFEVDGIVIEYYSSI